MLDQKSDETFVSAQRRAMNAERRLVGVIAIFVNEIETSRLCEIDLIGGKRELAPDHAPDLHIDLRSVKRSFVRHFKIIDSGIFQDVARHLFSLFPKLGFVDELLSELRRIMR